MKFASDVEYGLPGALNMGIFIRQLLVGHEKFKEPGVEMRVHHDLDAVARVHIGEHLKVSEGLLPDTVV